MKPTFSLRKIWDGWRSVRSPDNIKFTIRFSDEQSFDMFGSILELVDLYDLVRAKKGCDTMIGTGNIIQIKPVDGEAHFILDENHCVKTSFEHLEITIEQLLREVFSELEGGPTNMPETERKAYPHVKDIYKEIMK